MQTIENINSMKTHSILGAGEEVLLYDGNRIVARCCNGNSVSTGNTEFVMVVGTTEEIDQLIIDLGLKTDWEIKNEL